MATSRSIGVDISTEHVDEVRLHAAAAWASGGSEAAANAASNVCNATMRMGTEVHNGNPRRTAMRQHCAITAAHAHCNNRGHFGC